MEVKLIDCMGSDLRVVNAARVSFNKQSYYKDFNTLKDSDIRLINFLAEKGHWTPFAHPQLTFRVKAPIFVRTQCFKHKVGLVENEVSRRYVDYDPEFYEPVYWRARSEDKKQGSSDEVVPLPEEVFRQIHFLQSDAGYLYKDLIDKGVAPEQARMILPQSMYTEWYWTGSLLAFLRFVQLRDHDDAQEETRWVAKEIKEHLMERFPYSTEAVLNR